jgi:hypothetical protein
MFGFGTRVLRLLVERSNRRFVEPVDLSQSIRTAPFPARKLWPRTHMSPELEALDQLLGGELPLAVVRGFFGDSAQFVSAIEAMLRSEVVKLLMPDGSEVPSWQWCEVLINDTGSGGALFPRIAITAAGAKQIR